MIFSSGVSAALCVLFSCACSFVYLRRALHMYQLNSYQRLSYSLWLKQNRREVFSPLRLALCAFAAVCAAMLYWPSVAIVSAVANLQKPRPAKKPLVVTARVKRMLATFAVLSLALCAAMLVPMNGIALRAVCAAAAFAAVFCPPWLVMIINAINAPLEKAVARKYINEARDILRASPELHVVGITGSYGKTSTKYFLSELLSTRFNVYMTPGNFNTTLGVVRAVREGLRPTHEIFLCEMGARHRGDIIEICELVRPRTGVLTYIGHQHLETFGSEQAIAETKMELAQYAQKMFVNIDSAAAARQAFPRERVFYGGADGANYRVSGVRADARGLEFSVSAPDGECGRFSTKLIGSANVQNLTGAIAVAHSLGIPFETLAPAVRALKSVPHRLELKRVGELAVIDDAYNSNPEGARVALETLAACAGFKIAVTPGLVELGALEREHNIELGRRAALCCDYLVTVGQKQGSLVAAGAREAGMHGIFEAYDINEAMAHVRALPRADKIVLLLNDLPDNY